MEVSATPGHVGPRTAQRPWQWLNNGVFVLVCSWLIKSFIVFCVTDSADVEPIGRGPSPWSKPAPTDFDQIAIRSPGLPFNGLRPRNTNNYMGLLLHRPQRDGRLSWPGWLTHSGQCTNKVVICQPQIGHRAGKDRRRNY